MLRAGSFVFVNYYDTHDIYGEILSIRNTLKENTVEIFIKPHVMSYSKNRKGYDNENVDRLILSGRMYISANEESITEIGNLGRVLFG